MIEKNLIKNSSLNLGKIAVAHNFFDRFFGLMGKKNMMDGYVGVGFGRCKSLHTFFMRFSLDIIYTNQEGVIKKLLKNIKPNRITFGSKDSFFAYEFPHGFIEASNLSLGDTLSLT